MTPPPAPLPLLLPWLVLPCALVLGLALAQALLWGRDVGRLVRRQRRFWRDRR